eukprot:SAG31_NODE_12558_length_932_cov_1.774310_2_plen_67_part_01
MYAGSMLGVLVGQKMVTHDQAFAFMLATNIVNIPLGCLAMQVRGYFLVFVQLFEKYGTLIERDTALI